MSLDGNSKATSWRLLVTYVFLVSNSLYILAMAKISGTVFATHPCWEVGKKKRKGEGVRACWSSNGYFTRNSYSNEANTKQSVEEYISKTAFHFQVTLDVALRSSVVGTDKLTVQAVAQDMNYLYMNSIFFRNCRGGVGRWLITGKTRTVSSCYLLLTVENIFFPWPLHDF